MHAPFSPLRSWCVCPYVAVRLHVHPEPSRRSGLERGRHDGVLPGRERQPARDVSPRHERPRQVLGFFLRRVRRNHDHGDGGRRRRARRQRRRFIEISRCVPVSASFKHPPHKGICLGRRGRQEKGKPGLKQKMGKKNKQIDLLPRDVVVLC